MNGTKLHLPPPEWWQSPEGERSAVRFERLSPARKAWVRAESYRLRTLHPYTDHQAWALALKSDADRQTGGQA